ncbi:MAG: CoA transferase [Chloroflexi bacterium]|nr:CoA transferase [Chloroflexota bacterium]MYD66491.1 CoA transferase [Chloroflexota bacterium]
MSGPFEALRVIDLSSGQPGGVTTMVLADYGADVIKVEPPGGDPGRAEPASPMWLRGKRSVTLDLSDAADRGRLHALVRGADVVVASFAPGEGEAAEADYETLSALNPGLVYCSITGWGLSGPYAHYPASEPLVAAKSGRMQSFAGVVRREGPAYSAVKTGTHAATQSAIAGILGALLVRDRLGSGQLVETSVLRGMLPYDFRTLIAEQLTPRYPSLLADDPFARFGPDGLPMLGYQPVMTKDGRWIQFANLLEHLVHSSLVAMDLAADVLGDPRYAGTPNGLTPEAREEVRNIMLERVQERTAAEWMEAFSENGNVAAEIVGTAQEALSHPDMEANREVVDMEHPEHGTVRQLGLLARLTETPGEVGGAGPQPGEHTTEVLAEAPRAAWTPPSTNGSPPKHPLEGVTVLEFATIIAAPLGASLLGDMGARVIKVEPVDGGDPIRGLGVGLGAMFGSAKTTASKESICIDLKSERGQEIVSRLIEHADVIVHNYRPGVPDRLGIGYEQAKAIKPDIVWVSVNGYGPDGPGARRPSAHPIPGAVCGGALMQSGVDWPPNGYSSIDDIREASRWFSRANEGNPDPNTSMCVATTAMLGLMARHQTGKGQRIFLSMLGANGYANAEDFLSYDGKAERPTLDRWLHGTSALNRLYRSQDGWVFLAADDDASWGALAAASVNGIGADGRFATAEGRREHDAALTEALEAMFALRDADEWERDLIAAGVGCVNAGAYDSPGAFLLEDEHAQANGLLTDAQHALWGEYRRWGPPSTFSATPGNPHAGVLAGQHTDELLAEAGYSPAEVEALRADNVVWSEVPMELPEPVTVA